MHKRLCYDSLHGKAVCIKGMHHMGPMLLWKSLPCTSGKWLPLDQLTLTTMGILQMSAPRNIPLNKHAAMYCLVCDFSLGGFSSSKGQHIFLSVWRWSNLRRNPLKNICPNTSCNIYLNIWAPIAYSVLFQSERSQV